MELRPWSVRTEQALELSDSAGDVPEERPLDEVEVFPALFVVRGELRGEGLRVQIEIPSRRLLLALQRANSQAPAVRSPARGDGARTGSRRSWGAREPNRAPRP